MQSTQAEITQQDNNNYLISGSVGFSTVPDLMRQIDSAFKSNGSRGRAQQISSVQDSSIGVSSTEDIIIDMSQVSDCNSAGLSLMLEIVKSSRLCNNTVRFKNIPVALQTIAKAYGIENEIREMCSSHV